jgi:hypothetical protein
MELRNYSFHFDVHLHSASEKKLSERAGEEKRNLSFVAPGWPWPASALL